MSYPDDELEAIRRSLFDHDLPEVELKQKVESALFGLKALFEETLYVYGPLLGASLTNFSLDPRVWAEILSNAESFQYLPSSLKDNPRFMCEMLERNGNVYWLLEPDLRADKQLLLAALRYSYNSSAGGVSLYEDDCEFPTELVNDKEFVLQALGVDPFFSFVLPDRMRKDIEFASAALKINEKSALGLFQVLLSDRELQGLGDNPEDTHIIQAVKAKVERFEFASKLPVPSEGKKPKFKL
jgi:hypothetical protein